MTFDKSVDAGAPSIGTRRIAILSGVTRAYSEPYLRRSEIVMATLLFILEGRLDEDVHEVKT
jgi:hypothetical protein